MQQINMTWYYHSNVLPCKNSVLLIGEIDEGGKGTFFQKYLMQVALNFIKIAKSLSGEFLAIEPEKLNYPIAEKGKIRIQFQMKFPSSKQRDMFEKEISRLYPKDSS